MPDRRLLYYITDRTAFAADEPTRRRRLLEKIAEAARAGVDYIQMREKDLSTRELELLAREAVALMTKLRTENPELRTALLLNSRTDVAIAIGADGVHLRSDDISPRDVRMIWSKSQVGSALGCRPMQKTPVQKTATVEAGAGALPRSPLIGVSCHSPEEVQTAASAGATFAVFAPVFEKLAFEKPGPEKPVFEKPVFKKQDSPGTSPVRLALLEQACRATIPVLALGGINLENARSCLEAGAAGIAAIRLFQENDIASVVKRLR